MTKVIVSPLKLGNGSSVKTKRVRRASGASATIRVVDANSPTFASDLTHVFSANVVRARRANSTLSWTSPKIAAIWKTALAMETPKPAAPKKTAGKVRRLKK